MPELVLDSHSLGGRTASRIHGVLILLEGTQGYFVENLGASLIGVDRAGLFLCSIFIHFALYS